MEEREADIKKNPNENMQLGNIGPQPQFLRLGVADEREQKAGWGAHPMTT
jgi:hypothetical protein